MLIEKELTITQPAHPDTLDVHPRGQGCPYEEDHHFFLDVQAAGFIYRICGRCGTVRIGEQRR